jgi:uncharacterized RDD family membrane protein YckC
MFQVQEVGSDLLKIHIMNSMLRFPHFVRQEICKCMYGIIVVSSHLYKITFFRLLAENKSDVLISISSLKRNFCLPVDNTVLG